MAGETIANSQAKRSLYTFRLDENDGWEPSILLSWIVNISLESTLGIGRPTFNGPPRHGKTDIGQNCFSRFEQSHHAQRHALTSGSWSCTL